MISPPDIGSQDTDSGGPNGLPETQKTHNPKRSSSEDNASHLGSLFTGLRKALKENSQSPDTIIRATAEAARAQTGADGVAIALRARGAIFCRARSGDLAPEIGSQLNAQSGISGECMRTASILLCQDSESDYRVDPEVCRMMGIRSIVAVPLRGAVGIAGILEAFSARPDAFTDEHINWLRELAMVAEAAYDKERLAHEEQTMASLGSARRLPAIFTRSAPAQPPTDPAAATDQAVKTQVDQGYESFPRKYWVMGVTGLAVLVVLGIWLSWREPDLAEGASVGKSQNTAVHASSPATEVPAVPDSSQPNGVHLASKPGAGLDVVRKASGVERANEPEQTKMKTAADPGDSGRDGPEPTRGAASTRPGPASTAEIASNEPPPAVVITSEDSAQLSALTSSAPALPSIGVPISKGVTQAELIHKVDPVYPMQARNLRISGTVVLEVTIAEDGTVRSVKKVSGETILVGAATQAVRQWRYSPLLLNGKPVEGQRQVSIVFKLP